MCFQPRPRWFWTSRRDVTATVYLIYTYTGPCGGRDCSGGCQCFPEKGSRVSNISSCKTFLMFSVQCCLIKVDLHQSARSIQTIILFQEKVTVVSSYFLKSL
uniref:Uncharacterized protein n=1 Tax=Amazona collaria TaxID=241587 RepID=A0A8B9J1H5_9PSIT